MSRLRSAVKAARKLADEANLKTGLAVTKPGPATTRRVKKRGRNVNVAAAAGAAGATGAAATSLFGGDKKKTGTIKRRGGGARAAASKSTARKPMSQADRKAARTGVKKVRAADQATKDAKRKADTARFQKDVDDLAQANIKMNKAQKVAKAKTVTKPKPAAAKKPAAKKKVGGIRKFLLGDDGKFGGARGAIDFLPGKSRPKRKKKATGSPASGANRRPKPAGKAMGGMMKSKMASKGGARGGKKMMMPGGMKAGGSASKFPDLTGDGQVTQADILKGRGVTKKKNGGMMKSKMASKGGAKGGRMPGGMKNGGMAKKGYSKGGAVSRKPRGVGAALRGYGKALK